jgi:hypothetical protein
MCTKFWSGNLTGRDHSEDLEVDGKIVRKGVDWIYLAHYRDQWQVLLNTVTNLRVCKKQRIS